MRKGTKLGTLMIAMSAMLTGWLVISQSTLNVAADGEFTYDSSGIATAFTGSGAVTIPSEVTSLPYGVISDNSGVTSITVAGTTRLENKAFYNDTALSSVNIGSASYIAPDAFMYCTALSSISGGGGTYSAINNCIYTGTTLYLVPEGLGAVTIPSSCTAIASGAFNRYNGATSITIPATVTSIASGALSGSSIETIYGYSGSAAETYAASNGLDFIYLDESSSSDTSSSSSSSDSSNTSLSTSTSSSSDSSSDSDTSSSLTSDSTDSTSASSGGGKSGGISGGPSAGGGGHVPDNTPSTGVEDIDPRYLFCLGLALSGVAIIIYTRQKSLALTIRNSNNDELD